MRSNRLRRLHPVTVCNISLCKVLRNSFNVCAVLDWLEQNHSARAYKIQCLGRLYAQLFSSWVRLIRCLLIKSGAYTNIWAESITRRWQLQDSVSWTTACKTLIILINAHQLPDHQVRCTWLSLFANAFARSISRASQYSTLLSCEHCARICCCVSLTYTHHTSYVIRHTWIIVCDTSYMIMYHHTWYIIHDISYMIHDTDTSYVTS